MKSSMTNALTLYRKAVAEFGERAVDWRGLSRILADYFTDLSIGECNQIARQVISDVNGGAK